MGMNVPMMQRIEMLKSENTVSIYLTINHVRHLRHEEHRWTSKMDITPRGRTHIMLSNQ